MPRPYKIQKYALIQAYFFFMNFQQSKLSNGLRVLTERHEDVKSATLGVWIEAGAVYEREAERGLAHLLEHLVFKGTARRSMTKIAIAMDSLGGQMNAFTEREFVCYHVKVLAEQTNLALELLCDFVARPTLDEDDLELERGVILEEIRSVEDAPEELVEDVWMETLWPRSRWGRTILGTEESVSHLSVETLRDFRKTHYTPRNILVAVVGDVQHANIVKLCEKHLGDLAPVKNAHRLPAAPTSSARDVILSRDTEQVHLCCGAPAYGSTDPKRYAAWMLDTILTGGYSSRLFQEIREKRGLCYNIGSLSGHYRSAGYWGVATSVAPREVQKVAALIGKELRKVRDAGVSKSEWQRAQQMARVNILLSEESSSAQMSRIARNELVLGRQKNSDEVLAQLMAVSRDDIQRAAHEIFAPETFNLTAIGPFSDGASLHIEL